MNCYLTDFRIPGNQDFDDRLKTFLDDHPECSWARLNFHSAEEQYPAGLFCNGLTLELAPVTILYGGNGSGKSTILNLIAEILEIGHRAKVNKSPFFSLFSKFCTLSTHSDFDDQDRRCDVISSDDVFQHCFQIRAANDQIVKEQQEVIGNAFALKGALTLGDGITPLRGMEDVGRFLKDVNDRRLIRKSASAYVKNYARHTLTPESNGETALNFFLSAIDGAGAYLLDEPENSMSPAFQLKLVDFLENSARFFRMQFIIATHSPLVLGMKYAKIYDLDEEGAPERQWAELENIRILHDYFAAREDQFKPAKNQGLSYGNTTCH